MNFSPFGNPFQSTLPSMHHLTAKFADPVLVNSSGGHNTVMLTSLPNEGAASGLQYLPIATTGSSSVTTSNVQASQVSRLTTLPSNIQVLNTSSSLSATKYSSGTTLIGWENVPVHHFTAVDPKIVSTVPYNAQNNVIQTSNPSAVWPVRLIHTDSLPPEFTEGEPQDLCKPLKEEHDVKDEKDDDKLEFIPVQLPLQAWSEGGSGVMADYLSRLPTSTIPLSLHHFLKYSSDKKEGQLQELTLISEQPIHENSELVHHSQTVLTDLEQDSLQMETALEDSPTSKKRKKKQKAKEKKPRYRPGEVRLSTALDGSTLFCCPECHMAYPERFSLEQHLAGHKMERRFKCDVCGAGLKRKEHLDQHKRGHSTERPFVCSICMKGFKRNEHLTRHYVIHSGEKTYVCMECTKAFSRKDHLHKHTQTHIAKRVKAEMSQQSLPLTPSVAVPAPIMTN